MGLRRQERMSKISSFCWRSIRGTPILETSEDCPPLTHPGRGSSPRRRYLRRSAHSLLDRRETRTVLGLATWRIS